MLASLDFDALEIYSRDDIIEVLLEHGTPQATMWVGREAEFSDHGKYIIVINVLWPKDQNLVGTEIYGVAPSELCEVGFGALLEHMGFSEMFMMGSFHYWGNWRSDGDEDIMW
jgi:hypothetical protein